MRNYAKISSEFWINPIGRKIKACILEAKVIAPYLITCSHANMIGFYYLPLLFISHETGIPLERVLKGLKELIEIKFCSYDFSTECIWVHDMAETELGITLKESDKRITHVKNVYKKLPFTPLLKAFYEKYASSLYLESIFEAPSEGLRSQDQKQDQEQKQDQKQFQKQDDVGATCVAPSSSPLKIPFNKQICLVQNNLSIDIEIPLQNETYFLVNPAQLEHWKKTYLNIDVLQELRKIQAWNESNPSERKSESTILRHINCWLAKEQREYLHRQQALSINHPNRLAKSGLSPTLQHNLIVGEQWLNGSKTEK